MQVSEIAGVRPYLSTPEGLTGASGITEETGCDTGCGNGFGAGALGAEGGNGAVADGSGPGEVDLEEKIKAVIEAPAAAEPAAIKANVDFDIPMISQMNENEVDSIMNIDCYLRGEPTADLHT